MIEKINKLFNYFPNESYIEISLHENGIDINKIIPYHIFVKFKESKTIFGSVIVDHINGFDNKKFICEKLYESTVLCTLRRKVELCGVIV